MVPGIGVEPTSSGFSDQRSDRLSYPGILSYGVTDADRTRDIQGHNLMLYLLSYGHHLSRCAYPTPIREIFFRPIDLASLWLYLEPIARP